MNGPPRLPRSLLSLLVSPDDRESFLGDLDEDYEAFVEARGSAWANRWYWHQALRSLPHLARHHIGRLSAMTFRDFANAVRADGAADIAHAMRIARRTPVTTAIIALTLATAICVTTAVYSVVDAVVLRPLPFPESERVVELNLVGRDGQRGGMLSYADLQDYRRDTRTLSDVSGVMLNGATLTEGAYAQHLVVVYVDDAYQRVFRLRPSIGRYFSADEERADGAKVVMLSHALWQTAFGGDTSIVGRTISLDNAPATVVGVLPSREYFFPYSQVDAITPMMQALGPSPRKRDDTFLRAAARLKPGISLSAARVDVINAAKTIGRDDPTFRAGIGGELTPLRDVVIGDVRPTLILLAGAVAAVLLIACVNIANLLVARANARSRELSIRAALGASRTRLARQVYAESLVLAAIGGVVGLGCASALSRLLVHFYPGELPRAAEIALGGRVIVAGILVTLATALGIGVPTVRRVLSANQWGELRDGGRSGANRRQRQLSHALLASQIALSIALLFAAVLLVRTLNDVSHRARGFDVDDRVTFELYTPRATYPTAQSVIAYYDRVTASLRALPGTRAVSTANETPFLGNSMSDSYVIVERGDQPGHNPTARIGIVDDTFWRTLGVPMLTGRAFSEHDDVAAPRVAIINSALARRDFPGGSPLDRSIRWNGTTWRIVGVAASMRMRDMAEEPSPELYVPMAQASIRPRFVTVHSSTPAASLLPAVRLQLRAIDATIPMMLVSSMDDQFSAVIAPQRFRAILATTLGIVAILLSAIGIFGVMASIVSRQTREIGIRMALGETRSQSLQRVIMNAVRIALAGAVAGAAIAIAMSRWLATFLDGLSPTDPLLLAAIAAGLVTVAIAAAAVPARRASRVDPLVALRSD